MFNIPSLTTINLSMNCVSEIPSKHRPESPLSQVSIHWPENEKLKLMLVLY